jgi:hypothetical protein
MSPMHFKLCGSMVAIRMNLAYITSMVHIGEVVVPSSH